MAKKQWKRGRDAKRQMARYAARQVPQQPIGTAVEGGQRGGIAQLGSVHGRVPPGMTRSQYVQSQRAAMELNTAFAKVTSLMESVGAGSTDALHLTYFDALTDQMRTMTWRRGESIEVSGTPQPVSPRLMGERVAAGWRRN